MKRSAQQLSLIFTDEEGALRSKTATEMDIEPLDATFRDSNRAPLHSWFPYLEGYSPKFVDRVRIEYLPNAKRIIEPFAGSGRLTSFDIHRCRNWNRYAYGQCKGIAQANDAWRC